MSIRCGKEGIGWKIQSCYNENVSKDKWILIYVWLAALVGIHTKVEPAMAQERFSWAAYAERISAATRQEFTFLVPPDAEVIIIDKNNEVYTTIKADATGSLTREITPPESVFSEYMVFFSDGVGISSSVPFDFSKNNSVYLLPPTIYGITYIEKSGNLGFVGKAYALAKVELEIQLSTNQKKVSGTLADDRGEWQIQKN